ncbi:hypothetical protein L3Q82_010774 [Scortum barcoo]|uniref:Uncharacterized protein n=1 Tax=Scortum barcoo TaxID=214431 RepID=A0ACB8WCD3_9TELE|nr:hypothetical protein L3Q82_010774 [Scortum barcoo]
MEVEGQCLWCGKLGWWSLFLKGDRRVCSNYRGITLLSLPGKVSRQGTGEENSADSRPSDSGGTMRFSSWCRGTLDQLYTLHRVLEGLWEFVCPTSPHVLCGSGEGIRPCPRGFLKACVARGRRESRFGNHRISSLLFADDVVLMASSGQDLQHVLERFAAECEAAGMRISTSKSEAMVLDRKRVACPLQVGGEVLPQVEEFKYLGVLFTSEGKIGA